MLSGYGVSTLVWFYVLFMIGRSVYGRKLCEGSLRVTVLPFSRVYCGSISRTVSRLFSCLIYPDDGFATLILLLCLLFFYKCQVLVYIFRHGWREKACWMTGLVCWSDELNPCALFYRSRERDCRPSTVFLRRFDFWSA